MHACRGGGETDAPRLAAAALPPTDAPTLRSALRSALAPDCSLQRWHSHSSSGTCAPPPQTPPHRARSITRDALLRPSSSSWRQWRGWRRWRQLYL
jgi:hypothetical protein